MSSPSDTIFIVERAVAADSRELLDILEEQPFGGAVSLLYTRHPDAYDSFLREGEEVEIVVSRERPGNPISGMGACSINTVYVDGKPRRAGYLHSLRVRSGYRGRCWLQRGYEHLLREPGRRGLSLFFTTILEDNLAARRLLEKRRSSMPIYEPWDHYIGCAVLTRRGSGRPPHDRRTFRRATPADLENLSEFLNREGSRMQLFPVTSSGELAATTGRTPAPADFRLLLDPNGEILAAGALWDQRDHKQYVVAGYSGLYRLVRPVSFALPLLGFPRLPRPGSTLNFAALSFWAVKDDDPEVFERFLAGMRTTAAAHDFLFVGLSKSRPLLDCLRRFPHHRYGSLLYTVHYEHEKLVNPDRNRIPYLELGRL